MTNTTHNDIIKQTQGKVKRFILQEDLRPFNGRLLLAVSGGVDSVVMTDICQKLNGEMGLTLCMAHLNHGLRQFYSERDEAFTRRLALSRGIPFMSQRADVPAYAKEHKLGLEEAARKLRYAFLHEAAQQFDCARIALAHHIQDNAESILLNLMRGAGLTGLNGIRPKRTDGIVRPLLCLERPEIEAYAQAAHLDFVTDHTNDYLDFKRNRVRHVLLPEMQTNFNPQIVLALSRLGDIVHSENAWADDIAYEWLSKNSRAVENGLGWKLADFNTLPEALARRVVRQAVFQAKGDRRRLELQHVAAIMELAANPAPVKRLDLPDNILVVKQAGRLQILRMQQPLRQIKLPEETENYDYTLVPGQTLEIPQIGMRLVCRNTDNKNAVLQANALQNLAFFDIKKLVLPLHVRNYRKGDKLNPLGATGHTKLKKLFINAKVPAHQRKTWPLLVNGNNEILWTIGLRLSNTAKISDVCADFIAVETLLY